MTKVPQEFQKEMIFTVGKPNNAYQEYFVGESYLATLTTSGVNVFNVTFEPGCRNNWHIHHSSEGGGQILLCTAGHGYYQEWGKPAISLMPGSVVQIPPGVKHWHGAAHESWFSHLAIEVPGKDASTEWLEEVTPQQYGELQ